MQEKRGEKISSTAVLEEVEVHKKDQARLLPYCVELIETVSKIVMVPRRRDSPEQ